MRDVQGRPYELPSRRSVEISPLKFSSHPATSVLSEDLVPASSRRVKRRAQTAQVLLRKASGKFLKALMCTAVALTKSSEVVVVLTGLDRAVLSGEQSSMFEFLS